MTQAPNGLSRRGFMIGSLALLAGCGSGKDDETAAAPAPTATPAPTAAATPGATPSASPTSGPWSFTDDLGTTVNLASRPQKIVAYIGAAAVLWDFGVQAIGSMGPQRNENGSQAPATGKVDLAKVTDIGEEEVDLEKLASLQPDIIVVQKGPSGLDAYPLTEEQIEQARKIAPLVAIQSYGASADSVVGAYERLARSLGIDTEATALAQEKKRLSEAQDRLRQVLAGKVGLVTIFTFADSEGFYVAKVKDFPDLLAYAGLGLPIVEAVSSDNYFQKLSWEEAGKYPADVIFHDERPGSLQPDVLDKDYPTWRELPAVKAGQLGKWNAETVYSPRGLADAISALTNTVSSAKVDVVVPEAEE